jgi:hypothetical protein
MEFKNNEIKMCIAFIHTNSLFLITVDSSEQYFLWLSWNGGICK